MKKLLFPLIMVLSSLCHAADYKWPIDNHRGQDPKKIIFTNGASLTRVENSGLYASIKFTDKNGNSKEDFIEEGIVSIEAAYPNSRSASAAIVTSNCGGTMCPDSSVYLITVTGNNLQKALVSSSGGFSLNILINGNLVKATAKNVHSGSDKYGSSIRRTHEFLPEQNVFVDSEMQSYYREVAGKHVFYLFEHKLARERLARLVGLDFFRQLRTSMAVGTDSEVIDGRYIVFNACQAHACPYSSGSVIIDGIDDNVWFVQLIDRQFKSGGTKEMPNDEYWAPLWSVKVGDYKAVHGKNGQISLVGKK